MKKLNELLNCNVTAYGFDAFKGLMECCSKDGHGVVVSTLSPAVMYEMSIDTYYAPVIPRNSRFETATDVINADLDVNKVHVERFNGSLDGVRKLIVSRHQGTVEILKDMYPDADVLTGSVTQEDIDGCFVAGVLPPHLIAHCLAFKAVTINDFDYAKDDDLFGDELMRRLHICDAVTVKINNID